MATLKLKPRKTPAGRPDERRAPLRGSGAGVKPRPTLSQAQALRAEREARYQEQLRLRYGDRPPASLGKRGAAPVDWRQQRDSAPPPRHDPHKPRDLQPEAEPRARRANPFDAPRPRDAAPFDARRGPPADARRRPEPVWEPREPSGARGAARPSPPQRGPQDRPPLQRTERPAPAGGPGPRHAPPAAQRPPAPPPRGIGRGRRAPARDDDDDEDFVPAHLPGSMRLSKRMSELGIASRREADEWIAKGWVRVDGQVVGALGSRVVPGQLVTVDAKARHQQAQRVTVLLNKPVGYVSGQAEDGYEPAVVLVTPQNQWREDSSGTRFVREHLKSLVPAGRLDIDSVGLLVLTQDGRVAKQLIGEDSEVEKEYLVRVEPQAGPPLSDGGLALLRHGLELDGEPLRPARVEWVNEDQLRFVLREGKKRQIRRMCEAVGLKVTGLKRVRIGDVMLGDLPPGQWRYLRADERFVEPPPKADEPA